MQLRCNNASVTPLWTDLTLDVGPGEFVAILGPNGVGKSTLFRVLLGQRHLSSGTYTLSGRVGYIPQQQLFPRDLPLRGRDLVRLTGVPAHEVMTALERVDAAHLANLKVGTMSGGQQQLIRQAQAFAHDPDIILADEPLLSLDVQTQEATVRRLHDSRAAVLFITHGINPVLDYVDRILYLGPHGHMLGSVDEVLRGDVLTRLYGKHVEVAHINGKLVIV
ncbi:MAG: metal ABC transporter ATP-binding protein [Corynebacterium sp.]|nr:metal ABC transporter ATP-binding protein [Corynebacterium sp.]